jgi:hypothetical protein
MPYLIRNSFNINDLRYQMFIDPTLLDILLNFPCKAQNIIVIKYYHCLGITKGRKRKYLTLCKIQHHKYNTRIIVHFVIGIGNVQ